MYSFVLRQLNPMQKGIQTAHAVVEYANAFGDTDEYKTWANTDKTLIVLDGGTYQDMEEIKSILDDNNIKYATFQEEDLNNLMTSITLVADERVWDMKTCPDITEWMYTKTEYTYSVCSGNTSSVLPYLDEEHIKNAETAWIAFIGGNSNKVLRELIFSKKLAC